MVKIFTVRDGTSEKVTKLHKTKKLKDTFLSAPSFLFIHFGLVWTLSA